MNTNVWTESGGAMLRDATRLEARTLRQMHQPPARLEDWLQRREALRRRLLAAAGVEMTPCPLDIREHRTLVMDGYRIAKLTFQSKPGLRVTANLYRPDGSGRRPAVLNVHGHYPEGKIAPLVAARGHDLAREGFVVLSVDAIGAGERGTRPGAFEHHGAAGAPLFSAGETLLGAQVYDNMRAIDLLQSLGDVDKERIGVTGASGGGNQTLWISALDPRVKASVPVVSVGTFESYVTRGNCWCETLPDGLRIAEEWGALGLIAPNPLLILTANREQLEAFLPAEMLRAYADARRVYALYGAEERIAYQIIDVPHGYYPEMRRHMLGWFKHWLQGSGAALPRTLPADPALPPERLRCFEKEGRPPEVGSLIEYVSQRTREVKEEFPSQGRLDTGRKRRELAQTLRLPGGPAFTGLSQVVPGEEEGLRWRKFTVEPERGALIPCMLIEPRAAMKTVVLAAHPDGKEECLGTRAARAVLASGKGLCLVDLRTVGETRWAHPDDQVELYTARAALWVGRTMLGDWVKDLIAVRAALGRVAPGARVEMMGFGAVVHRNSTNAAALARGAMFALGDTTVAALAAAALDDGFSGVDVAGGLASYVVEGEVPRYRYGLLAPGMLKWGDVTLLAALAQCPVRVRWLAGPRGKRLPPSRTAAWLAETRELARRLTPKARGSVRVG
jgi:hypothetical protein